jgi:hypothetical protein
MLALGATVDGAAEFVTAMSADAGVATRVLTVAVLFARLLSLIPELTESVSLMVVPLGVATPTWTTSVKVESTFMSLDGRVQEIFPPDPTAGVVHVQAAGDAKETKVVLDGMASLKTTFMADCGPLLFTVCVYVMLPPGTTGFGVPELVITISATEHCAPERSPGVLESPATPRFVAMMPLPRPGVAP